MQQDADHQQREYLCSQLQVNTSLRLNLCRIFLFVRDASQVDIRIYNNNNKHEHFGFKLHQQPRLSVLWFI